MAEGKPIDPTGTEEGDWPADATTCRLFSRSTNEQVECYENTSERWCREYADNNSLWYQMATGVCSDYSADEAGG